MKNNKLTTKYIKDVFRFMEMYHITDIGTENVCFEYIKDGIYDKYNIIIMFCDNIESMADINERNINLFCGHELSEVINKIKNSEYYMMELV